MSAIPQGAFAAVKIKEVLENQCGFFQKKNVQENKFRNYFLTNAALMEQLPFKYSSKLMNSIWGLYNQYSVHNLKKNKDSQDFAVYNNQCF